MNEPLDPPDSCDPAPDPEVKRLKEDVRALRGLLRECNFHITLAVGSPYTCYLFNEDELEAANLLRNKIDAELNG